MTQFKAYKTYDIYLRKTLLNGLLADETPCIYSDSTTECRWS